MFCGGHINVYHLVAGATYTVGRKDCDVLIAVSDPSISRSHATISVAAVPAGELSNITFVPDVFVSDSSKHGTFVNGDRVLSIEKARKVGHDDTIVFGRDIKSRLRYTPIVVALSSSLNHHETKDVVTATCKIGGILREPLLHCEFHKERVAPFMFAFCTNEVTGEEAALTAMLCGYVLVSPRYITDLFSVIRDSCALPMSAFPQPGSFDAMRNRALVDRPYCRPDPTMFGCGEFLLQAPRDPSSAFRMLHFLFLDESLMNRYKRAIEIGGGYCSATSVDAVLKWNPQESEFLPLQSLVVSRHSHGKNVFVVVPSAVFSDVMAQVITGTGELTDTTRAFCKLWAANNKLLHEENIHVAIYCADTASQIMSTSPGVLCRDEMETDITVDEECDSNATEDGFASPPTPKRKIVAETHHPVQIVTEPKPSTSPSDTLSHQKNAQAMEETLYESWKQSLEEPPLTVAQAAARGDQHVTFPSQAEANLTPKRDRTAATLPISPSSCRRQQKAAEKSRALQYTEDYLCVLCQRFGDQTVEPRAPVVEQICCGSLQHRFLSDENRRFLRNTHEKISGFLANLQIVETNVRHKTIGTQSEVKEIREKCQTIASAIEATMERLGMSLF